MLLTCALKAMTVDDLAARMGPPESPKQALPPVPTEPFECSSRSEVLWLLAGTKSLAVLSRSALPV